MPSMNRCNFNGRDGAVSGKGGEMGGRATWSPPAVDRKGRETPAADGCRIRRRTSDGRNAAIPRDSMAVESTQNRTSFVNDRQQQRSVIAQPWTAGFGGSGGDKIVAEIRACRRLGVSEP